jgi:hypothetical protein
MSEYKIEVNLKQYTPLLHFQGKQEGACLRASEVKPKLDRFVLDYLEGHHIEIPSSWQLHASDEDNNQSVALRYKMRFCVKGEPTETSYKYKRRYDRTRNGQRSEYPLHSLYFGAMGEENFDQNGESRIKGVYYDTKETPVIMTILCLERETILINGTEKSLTDLLKNLIPPFFALHCFGTRSNKGFGSFAVAEINGNHCPTIEPETLVNFIPSGIPALYYGEYCLDDDEILYHENYLNDIQAISALMKGGINYTHGRKNDFLYYKGAIFQYFMELQSNVHSEKAIIKRDVLPCDEEDQVVRRQFQKADLSDTDEDQFLYMRGVLGLTQEFEYKIDENRETRRKNNQHSFREGTVVVTGKKIDGKSQKPLITRFQNPVQFKPYENYLLLIPQKIPPTLLGESFVFSYRKKIGRNIIHRECEISIPSEFNLDDFLNAFATKYYHDAVDKYANGDERGPIKFIIDVTNYIQELNRVAARKGGT